LDLASLSRNARFVVDSASGHQIPNENPALVAQATRRWSRWCARDAGSRPGSTTSCVPHAGALFEVVDFGNGVWSLARPEYESAVIE
jgi:hypothetical protein